MTAMAVLVRPIEGLMLLVGLTSVAAAPVADASAGEA
jgi:hypothetical protein